MSKKGNNSNMAKQIKIISDNDGHQVMEIAHLAKGQRPGELKKINEDNIF